MQRAGSVESMYSLSPLPSRVKVRTRYSLPPKRRPFLSTFSSPSGSSGSSTSSLTISMGFPSASTGACDGLEPPARYLAHLPPLWPRKPPLRFGVLTSDASLFSSSDTAGTARLGGLPSLFLRGRRDVCRPDRLGVAEREGWSESRDGVGASSPSLAPSSSSFVPSASSSCGVCASVGLASGISSSSLSEIFGIGVPAKGSTTSRGGFEYFRRLTHRCCGGLRRQTWTSSHNDNDALETALALESGSGQTAELLQFHTRETQRVKYRTAGAKFGAGHTLRRAANSSA